MAMFTDKQRETWRKLQRAVDEENEFRRLALSASPEVLERLKATTTKEEYEHFDDWLCKLKAEIEADKHIAWMANRLHQRKINAKLRMEKKIESLINQCDE